MDKKIIQFLFNPIFLKQFLFNANMPQVVFNTSIDIHDINIGSTKEGRLEWYYGRKTKYSV
jgi:hypothetical protein